MRSLASFGRRQSAKLRTLSRPQAVVLAAGSLLCAGVWVAAATGRPGVAMSLLAAVLGVLLLGVLHLSRWIAGVHRASQLNARELRTTVEQMQRRLVAAVEAERVTAGDRHGELTKALVKGQRDGRRGADLLLRAQSREIEALFQLFQHFTPRAPMPSSGDFALNPTDLLELLHLVRDRRPRTVLELGSGTSTVWLAYALEQQGGRLISLDHDHGYAQKTRALLVAHGLDAVAEVRDAPLTSLPVDGRTYQWYEPSTVADLDDVELLVIDGPPAATGPDARYPALHVLERRLAPAATVVLDDADRADEQDAVRRWTDSITGLTQERHILGRHAVLSYRRAEKAMAAAAS